MTNLNVKKMLLDEIGTDHSDGLRIGSIKAKDLVNQFGSPLYVYNQNALLGNIEKVRVNLPDDINLLFAIKANPSLAIAEVFNNAGIGAEVSSAGELVIALSAGFKPENIQFSGPGKSYEDLILAIDNEIGAINIESAEEYVVISQLARQFQRKVKIAIRVNMPKSINGARMSMAGYAKKFGVDYDQVPLLYNEIINDDFIQLMGLHAHSGSQCFDALGWLGNVKQLIKLANQLEHVSPIKTLNFGGGFGVPLFDGDKKLDISLLGQELNKIIQENQQYQRQYYCELGRYFTATSGVYLTRILYRKNNQDTEYAIVDGGMNHHAAAAGMGSVVRRNYPIVHTDSPYSDGQSEIAIAGPLCTPADEFANKVMLPEINSGDVVGILGSGAYGLSFSNLDFLSHPGPAEVMVIDDRPVLIRKRGNHEDTLSKQQSVKLLLAD